MKPVPASVMAARYRAQELFDARAVTKAIDQAAVRLSVLITDENPLLVCVLNGGLPFTAALMQRLHFPLQLSYVHVGRYGDATRGGELVWHARGEDSFEGRHVVLVDDILDRGITLAALREWLEQAGASKVTVVVLIDKQVSGERPIQADVVALRAPDQYLFGWGMDYQGYWRNLTGIYALPDGSASGEPRELGDSDL